MADTKEMKVRIQLRNGTYQNLQNSTLNLMKGEIAVVIDSTNVNHLRYKIGDGTKAFKQLPWADGIITYNDQGDKIIPYNESALGSKILGLKPGDGIVLEPEEDNAGNKTGFVKVKSSIGSMAVTSLNDLTGAVTIGTTTGSGIGISKSGQTIQVTNTGVRSITAGDNTTFGAIKVNTNGTTTPITVSNYGIFDGKLAIRDTSVNRDIVISIPTLSVGNEIPIQLKAPKDLTAGATIAYTEDITSAIDAAKITIEAGTGIDVTTSTDGKTYTINNTGILSAKAGDSYIGASTSAGVLTITNKSTLAQGSTLGSVKLNGGSDVVVKDYGIFNDNITLKNTTVNKQANLHAPAWTPEDTEVGAEIYLPKKGGTLALISDIPASTKETVVIEGTGIGVTLDSSDPTKNKYTVKNKGVTAITTGDDLGSIKVTTNGTPADVVVKDYGTFQDIITLKKSGSTKTAEIHVPNWTPENTGVGSIYQLPVLSQGDGGVIATQTYVNNAIAQIHSFEYIVSTNAATTPKGIVWYNGTTKVTGTLEASSSTEYKIYLVPCKHAAEEAQKGYDEYLTVKSGSTYSWELIGNTQDVDLSDYVNTLTGTANSGVITNLTKSGNTLTVTSKSLATASPTVPQGNYALDFIDTISQAADGKITATKKAINRNLLVTEEFHTAMNAAGTAAGGATDDTIMVIGAKPSITQGQFIWDTVNLNAYAKKTDILNPTNYYWSNLKVSSSSSLRTEPTFGKMTLGDFNSAGNPSLNKGSFIVKAGFVDENNTFDDGSVTISGPEYDRQEYENDMISPVSLVLPKSSGTLISTGTVLILNGGNASGWDVA